MELARSSIALAASLQTTLRHRSALEVPINETSAYLRKSANLALCYQGFGDEFKTRQAIGAGRSAALSNIYDVLTDQRTPNPKWTKTWKEILSKEGTPPLEAIGNELWEKDTSKTLADHGLERGSLALQFILEMMGLRDRFRQFADIDKIGLLLQIADDVLDYEEDLKNENQNCLESPKAIAYLNKLIEELPLERMMRLFPFSWILLKITHTAREKAKNILNTRGEPIREECPERILKPGDILKYRATTILLNEEFWEKQWIEHLRYQLTNRDKKKYGTFLLVLQQATSCNPLDRLTSWRAPSGIAPALDVSYFACREVDDVVDGDKPLPPGFKDIPEWMEYLKTHIQDNCHRVRKSDTTEFLFKRMLFRLGRQAKQDILKFLDAMLDEYNRRVNRKVMTEEELTQLNQNSFDFVHNLTFMIFGSRVRAHEVPELAQAQGRLYALTDLKNELKLGIINIPKEVIDKSGLTAEQLMQNPDLIDENLFIQEWIRHELDEGQQLIETLRNKDLKCWKAKKMVNFLLNGIEKRLKKHQLLNAGPISPTRT